jgi:shikimate dehydrogenase
MISTVDAFGPCAVIGQPIAHSLSPRLHAAMARQFGRALDYRRLDAGPAEFAATVAAFFAGGGRGLNVTLPHKIAAFELAGVRHPRAQWAGAANTLWQEHDVLHADNSDGAGLINDLLRLRIELRDRHLVVLGAGGAAAGVLPLLLQQAPARITIINRNRERGARLCARSQDARVTTTPSAPADLIISTVSDGVDALITTVRHHAGTIVYDLNYGARAQPSQHWAQARHCRWHDGFGMLIEQAAISFALWHGVRPDTAPLHRGDY